MTHPAQHHVDASKKRQRAWVEGGARGGSSNRPGKAGALKGGASEDRETQSDTRALVPHLRDARFPPPDTVAGAEEQKERARGGALRRADGGVADDDYVRSAKAALLSDAALGGSADPTPDDLRQMDTAADDAERNFRGTYRDRAHNGVETSSPNVAAQGVLRQKYGEPNVGVPRDRRVLDYSAKAAQSARDRQDTETPGYQKGGRTKRASGGPTIPTPPYAGARTADNRVDPSPATADKNEMRQMPSRDERDYAGKELGLAKGGASFRTPSGGVSSAARREAEGKGETMPGGKFPIRNASDLANAKHDVGRASDPAAARRWIDKRAKELGEPPLGG